MSGERHEVESEIVLPDGMELVVPPPARDSTDPLERSRARRGSGRPCRAPSVNHSPFVQGAEPRRAPVA